MDKKINRYRSLLANFCALVMFSVMVTLLVGKSVHIYGHYIHDCHHEAHNHHEEHNHHDCKICNFELTLFDKANEVVVASISALILPIVNGYIPQEFVDTNLLASTSRAPPQSLIY